MWFFSLFLVIWREREEKGKTNKHLTGQRQSSPLNAGVRRSCAYSIGPWQRDWLTTCSVLFPPRTSLADSLSCARKRPKNPEDYYIRTRGRCSVFQTFEMLIAAKITGGAWIRSPTKKQLEGEERASPCLSLYFLVTARSCRRSFVADESIERSLSMTMLLLLLLLCCDLCVKWRNRQRVSEREREKRERGREQSARETLLPIGRRKNEKTEQEKTMAYFLAREITDRRRVEVQSDAFSSFIAVKQVSQNVFICSGRAELEEQRASSEAFVSY